MARLKLLVAGDPASIHATRFVNLLQEAGYDVRMFQSEHFYWQEEHLHDTVLYVSNFENPNLSAAPERGNTLIAGSPPGLSYDGIAGRMYRKLKAPKPSLNPVVSSRRRHAHLAAVIRRWRPDIVFSLKLQNDGYTVAAARRLLGSAFRARWVHFTWGTDLEFFGKHPDHAPAHLPRIREALGACDFLLADCERDARQAADFGFKGEQLGTCIAAGGFDLHELDRIRTEAGKRRDVILVKGREGGHVGKAMNVMRVLGALGARLRDWRVRIVMATAPVQSAAAELSRRHGIDCAAVERLAYQDLLRLFAASRVAISASEVDGTPSFLLEAMAMGALPVHSDIESVRDWVVHGENGLLFPVEDVAEIGRCVERAMTDDSLTESARTANRDVAAKRMDRNAIRAKMKDLIEHRIVAQSGNG